ncbi:LLM class flavin-dependent oxidoreductase [Dermatobacter hominis]|uniref:LLM class flavin-dependent oxidoreductase n=1 Tax=Dermatobacter hominis TaxID=2884263 RepID=UPI001D125A45|nr:LLM class flavin-dependent oxidoreductase [Dermatobacter hominis]UDY36830.1 LLM class flavin-dependent oxidoreductase [Dermatobacter hominis]
MHVSIQTPPEHTTYAALLDIWQAADELGFTGAYTFDHMVPLNDGPSGPDPDGIPAGPQLEGWMALAALASHTARLEVGTLVTGVTYRHPSVLAKMAVTLDRITDGRAVLGIGAAWHQAEHERYGIAYPEVGERMERLDEALQVFRLLCAAGADGGRADFDGRWYSLDDAPFDPGPVRPGGIPVLVGGSGPRLLRLVARRADRYNGFWAPWEWGDVNARLDDLLAGRDRTPGSLQRTAFVFGELSGDATAEAALVAHFARQRGGTDDEVRSRVLVGSPDHMVEVLRSFADAGVDGVIVNLRSPVDLGGLERFAREVLPAVAGPAPA